MNKTLIVSGGNTNKNYINQLIRDNTFTNVIAVDKGLEALGEINILPEYIIGDFDSVDKEILNKYKNRDVEIRELNPEKDYTDTHMAIKLAMELGSDEVVITGAIGTRIDHVIANIHIMKEGLEKNIDCKIIDEYSEIIIINKDTKIEKENKYISLIPLTTEVFGVTLEGFKYKLENATLRVGDSIGISNEVISETATIRIGEGILIVIKAREDI